MDIAHAGLVYGKPGYVCSRCAAQTKYPPDEVLEVDTRSGCNQINLPAPTFRVSGACDCCRNDSPKLTPGVLHGKVASLCGPCSALDGDDWIGAMARGLAALWDRREAFEAFCKRAVAAVHEVAPQASAIADHFDVGGAEAWNVFVNAPGREQCVVRCYPEWQDPEPYIRAVVTAWLEGKP